MRLEPTKWNPFRFFRKSNGKGGGNDDVLAVMPDMPLDPFQALERWFGDFSPHVFQPRIDVVDEDEALRISADLPGMERKDVEVLAEDGFLVLRGEKKHEAKSEEKGCFRLERAFGTFQRVIPLPDDVELDGAEAKFNNGVLTLRLPKGAKAKADTHRIEIK
jgi:HSP20 family protein